jgi:hypothetical protein
MKYWKKLMIYSGTSIYVKIMIHLQNGISGISNILLLFNITLILYCLIHCDLLIHPVGSD